ncbi:MAG TPA: hypothetical protein VGI20_14055 [Rhizomicrobium sp.]|jgi:hypothetical protein
MESKRLLAPLALAFILSGCATAEIPYDHSSAGIRSVGLLTPGIPDGASIVLASDPGQSFGLVGALVDAGLQNNREGKFEHILASQQFVAANEFWSDLTANLQRDGYAIVPIAGARDRSDFLKKYPTPPSPVDAYLDVIVQSYGYMAAGIGSANPYRPFMLVKCRLVRAADSAVLMQDQIALNALNNGGPKQVTLSPEPAYAFPGMDDLVADPKNAAAGVKTAFQQSTTSIGNLLK